MAKLFLWILSMTKAMFTQIIRDHPAMLFVQQHIMSHSVLLEAELQRLSICCGEKRKNLL